MKACTCASCGQAHLRDLLYRRLDLRNKTGLFDLSARRERALYDQRDVVDPGLGQRLARLAQRLRGDVGQNVCSPIFTAISVRAGALSRMCKAANGAASRTAVTFSFRAVVVIFMVPSPSVGASLPGPAALVSGTIVSANPAASSAARGVLFWSLSSLSPFASAHYAPEFTIQGGACAFHYVKRVFCSLRIGIIDFSQL
jgi:hypothetical protein